MAASVFYSWQSDLPNATNRSFIENCIKEAIKQLTEVDTFCIDVCLDRDTKDEPGTPDIVKTIFNKIDNSKVFIADVTIINKESDHRKTPNPNVLLELGYAAKVLGWEKIICIYNTDHGDYKDLPFDIKSRRSLSYSINDGNRAEAKKKIVSAIIETINMLNRKGLLTDDLEDYLKVQVDTHFLTIIRHLQKIVHGYDEVFSLRNITEFLDLDVIQISEYLKEKCLLGFQVFKKYEYSKNELKIILDRAIASPHYKREVTLPIINLLRWIDSFDKINRSRTNPDLFLKQEEHSTEYKIGHPVDDHPHNKRYPERYILLKKLDGDEGMVQDFGDFQEAEKVKGLLNYYKINEKYIERYSKCVSDFIEISHNWLDVTNGEFIIDDTKAFELREH